MSQSSLAARRGQQPQKNSKPSSHSRNEHMDPFDTPFDDENVSENEDEWWNDDAASEAATDAPKDSRMTQWPTVAGTQTRMRKGSLSSHISSQVGSKKHARRYSVQKPVRDKSKHKVKLQNAKAGIKVVTNFSRHHGPAPVAQPPMPKGQTRPVAHGGMFVDLAALQALDTEVPNNNASFWKSVKGPDREDGQAEGSVPRQNAYASAGGISRFASRRNKALVPSPIKLESDLSPCDRPIVIGISIPSARLAEHATSPQTAHTTHPNSGLDIPETPTIVVTPAQNGTAWNPDHYTSQTNARPASSVYSRTTVLADRDDYKVPPVPQLPRDVKRTRDSTATLFDEDITPETAKPRIMSSCTDFEEDTTPIVSKTRSPEQDIKHTSIAIPADHRTSRGWWNYIVTPFLTRSNTLASPKSATSEHPPALPTMTKAEEAARENPNWEKMFSAFSPLTPETSTTIASDAWWDKRNTMDGTPKQHVESENNTFSPGELDDQSGTLPFMLVPSATVLDRHRRAAAEGNHTTNISITNNNNMRRDNSVVSILSPSDRDAPIVLDASSFPPPPLPTAAAAQQMENERSATRRPRPSEITVRAANGERAAAVPSEITDSPRAPPPYSPPRPHVPIVRAIFPPGHHMNLREPASPGPLSPGGQQAMSSRGGIAMSEVPLTPAPRRSPNINGGYENPMPFFPPPPKATKAEKKRRRNEKEDEIAHKGGGLWRGRGCISNRGCYGRKGAEGRKRRRCWCGLIFGFLAMIILIIVLATQLHHSAPSTVQQPQWLNLTGYPPIFTGISTVAQPENPVANSGCVFPATMWSCALPKELQQSSSVPNFRFQIQWDNSSAANATFANVTGNPYLVTRKVGNPVTAGQFIKRMLRRAINFSPSPAPPTFAEEFFLGNTTDGVVSPNKAGEATPFYISLLSTTDGPNNGPAILKRTVDPASPFPNLTALIPPPALNPNGTFAPANLLPSTLPTQQPVKLYDRGLPTEHYSFYSYYDRSIFLKSTALLNETNIGSGVGAGEVPADLNGGSTKGEALFRCTWAQTRLLVQIWTRKNNTAKLLNATAQANFLSSASNETEAIANDFTNPGSMPYPVTITVDRHGGNVTEKSVYCYQLDAREQAVPNSAKFWIEHRDSGGTIVNPAPGIFGSATAASDAAEGGFDGGNSGCSCEWQNWVAVVAG